MIQPQEVETFYLLPALRSELCRALVEEGLSQRDVAQLLGLTEAAVSQYVHNKRAQQVELSKKAVGQVEKSARAIVQGRIDAFHALSVLCDSIKQSGELCDIHMKFDKTCPSNCRECFEPNKNFALINNGKA
ncbi:MAG TPA: helix-turn-helix domain-containing protein [Candidatus Norongarragalinales archaeon]|jgi:hypothetical protein|nr:helix-turn-helix domain-containing protein [Candidatus Norongarragalinales archaeon]